MLRPLKGIGHFEAVRHGRLSICVGSRVRAQSPMGTLMTSRSAESGVRRGRGGPPALRGFRLQMLYVLHRLLVDADVHAVVLETFEDAAFLNKDAEPIDVVQVKSEQTPITPAGLRDTTIVARALLNAGEGHTLASYSGFGSTLVKARDGDEKASAEVADVLASVLGSSSLITLFS